MLQLFIQLVFETFNIRKYESLKFKVWHAINIVLFDYASLCLQKHFPIRCTVSLLRCYIVN